MREKIATGSIFNEFKVMVIKIYSKQVNIWIFWFCVSIFELKLEIYIQLSVIGKSSNSNAEQ